MQRFEVSGAVQPLYGSLCVKGLMSFLRPPPSTAYVAKGLEQYLRLSSVPAQICNGVTFTFTIVVKYPNPYEDLLAIIIAEQCGVAVSFQHT